MPTTSTSPRIHPSTIGAGVRSLREFAGLTQEAVAGLASTSPSYLSRVESGRVTPSEAYVSHIARVIATAIDARAGREAA